MLALLALLTLFWGFNWPVVKTVLTEMAPLHFRSWCLAGGAAGLFAMAGLRGLRLRVPRGAWGRLTAISFFNVGAWSALAIYGITLMDSGRAAVLAYTFPIFGILFSLWVLKETLTRRRSAGLIVGMAGLALLLGTELSTEGRSPLGAMLLVGSAISWASGTVIMKRWPVDLPTTSFVAWQLLISFVLIFLGALLFEPGSFSLLRLSTRALLGILFNVFVCYVFCYWAWMKIATVAPVAISSLSTLMIPVVGVFSGMLVLGERPQWYDYAALAMIVAALAIVLMPPRAIAKARAAAANSGT